MNNIVIFGCDNSGKSTLGKNLLYYLKEKGKDCSLIHSPGNTTKEVMENFMRISLVDKDKTPNKVSIFDRFPIIEESVYGEILRDGSKFKDKEDIDRILKKIDLFIYCFPGANMILNWGIREQYPGVKENANKLIEAYENIAKDFKEKGYPIKTYNYISDDFRSLL